MRSNIKVIRSLFNELDGVIIEVSSLKYLYKNNLLVHNRKENSLKKLYRTLEKHEIYDYVNKIINILPNKKIIFINHFLHFKIKNRELINYCLKNPKKNIKIF